MGCGGGDLMRGRQREQRGWQAAMAAALLPSREMLSLRLWLLAALLVGRQPSERVLLGRSEESTHRA